MYGVQYMTRAHVKMKCTEKNGTFHVYHPPVIVCCSYAFVCISMQPVYYHIYRMLLVCTRMKLLCYSYALFCYSYVTRMYSYVFVVRRCLR